MIADVEDASPVTPSSALEVVQVAALVDLAALERRGGGAQLARRRAPSSGRRSWKKAGFFAATITTSKKCRHVGYSGIAPPEQVGHHRSV